MKKYLFGLTACFIVCLFCSRNYCYSAANAFEPNEKEVSPASMDSAGGWLTYTILYQNTGNTIANSVLITDTLDANLNPSTFQLLSYSVVPTTQISGNVIKLIYPFIELPDSATSDSLSRGFVKFRVQVKNTVSGGTQINNTASISFNSNPAIVTNTTTNCTAVYTDTAVAIGCGDSVIFENVAYYIAGYYTDTFSASDGCDSVVLLQLRYSHSPVLDTAITIACGETIHIGNYVHYATGSYVDTITAPGGCDSIVRLQLNVSGDTIYLFDTICVGQSVLFNSRQISTPGTYAALYISVAGCDSTVIFQLNFSTDTASCLASIYPNYQPLLDSINIWNYIVQANGLIESPGPNNNNPGLRGLYTACQYPFPKPGYYGDFSEEEYTEGDTLINGHNYSQLFSEPEYDSTCIAGFIREDITNRTVYFQDVLNDPEVVLYNFSMLTGDSIYRTLLGIYDTLNLSAWYRLDSVRNIQLISGVHRIFYLDCDTCPYYVRTMIWIEGVGSQVELAYPYFEGWGWNAFNYYPCQRNNNDNGYPYDNNQFLSCFSHNQKVYFDACAYGDVLTTPNSFITDSCSYLVSINNIPDIGFFTLYPNPASNQITLSFDVNQSDVFEIEVLDMQGRQALPSYQVGRLSLGIQTKEMNISTLGSGFYLVACKSDKGIIYRKLVVRND